MKQLLNYIIFATCFFTLLSCHKEYSFEQGNILPAGGSLWDSAGNCLPSVVHGTFYNGVTPGSDTAFVEVQVNVTQTGSYNIETELEDGFSFADSGFFSTTGINIIKLKPVGVPIINTTSIFTFSFDSTSCSFTVTIQDSTGTGLGGGGDTTGVTDLGDWQFATDSGGNFHGDFAYVSLFPDSTISGYYDLGMTGFTPTGDTELTVVVLLPSSVITPGTYYSQPLAGSDHGNCYMGFAFVNTGTAIYSAISGYPSNINLAVTISSFDAATRLVKGTLSGTALVEAYYDEGAAIKIDGTFSATVP